jgi:integrase
MRKRVPTIDAKRLAEIGASPQSILDTEGKALVPGLFGQRRTRRLVWLIRYRAGSKQREFTLGHQSGQPDGTFGHFEGAIALHTINGRELDLPAELVRHQGASEPIHTSNIGLVAGKVRAFIDAGNDPVAVKRGLQAEAERVATEYDFMTLAKEFLAHGRTRKGKPIRPATTRGYTLALLGTPSQRAYAADLHGRDVRTIRRSEIQAILDKIAQDHPATAVQTKAAISRFFSWAVVRRDEIMGNPAAATEDIALEKRSRVLTDAELRKLWAATEKPTPYHAIIRLLLLTGARRMEVGGIRDSVLEDGVWTIPAARTKSGKELVLPLSRQAQAILEGWTRVDGRDRIFSFGTNGFDHWGASKAALDQVLKFAKPWRHHDLRRTVQTRMAGLGVDQGVVNRVLNHAIGAITETYDRHDYLVEKAAALQKWADELDRIIGNPPPENVVPIRTAS